MAKIKLTVKRLLPSGIIIASNQDTAYKIVVKDNVTGKTLTEAQADKAKPGTFSRQKVQTEDRITMQLEPIGKTTYQVGDELTINI